MELQIQSLLLQLSEPSYGNLLTDIESNSQRKQSSLTNNKSGPSPDALQARIDELEYELTTVRTKGKLMSQELDLFRQRRVVFWSDRFRNTFDAWNLMNHGFQRLKDDTALFCGDNTGYRLQPSLSLLRVPFLTYRIRLTKSGLTGLLLAPVVDVPLTAGEICVRIFSEQGQCIAMSTATMCAVNDKTPIELTFPAIKDSDQQELTLRVFVQGVDAPVRLFEMRRYALGGFGKLSTKPFFGYMFSR
jgi:hypothetical protein